MAWAIPAGFEAVPVQMAADMGTRRGMQMQRPLRIAVRRYFLQSPAQDCALAGLQVVGRANFAGRDIVGEILRHCRVFAQIVFDGGDRLRDGA